MGRTIMDLLRGGRWARGGLLAATFAMGASLVVTSLLSYRSVVHASGLVSRSQGEALLRSTFFLVRPGQDPPERSTLAALLEEQAAAGLRCVAIFDPQARVIADAGSPLASLKGHAQLLAERLPADGRERKKAERIVLEAQRLETLSGDLLDFSRSGPIDRKEADPAALLRAAAESVDASRDLERIFEPFYTTRPTGTGLGLAVAQRIVQMHGGTLTAANDPGGGASFRMAIPRA